MVWRRRILLLAVYLFSYCVCFDGDACYDKTWSVKGTCKNLTSCLISEKLLTGREPQLCGFERGRSEPSVCCPYRKPPPLYFPDKGKECYHAGFSIRGTCMPRDDCPATKKEKKWNLESQNCGTDSAEICCPPLRSDCDNSCDCRSIDFASRDPGKTKSIAKYKCWEYSRFVCPDALWYRSNETIEAQFSDFCGAGHVISKRQIDYVEGWAHGEPVKFSNDYPHVALLGNGLRWQIVFSCGGSLIAPDFILTAAHCGQPRWALMGTLDRRDANAKPTPQQLNPEFPSYPQLLEVQEMISHPEYSRAAGYNDIALLRLKEPAQMTATVRPACLHTARDELGTRVTGAGWGDTSDGAELPSNVLVEAAVLILPLDNCSALVDSRKLPQGLTDSHLCAGGDKDQDSCPGDSGGPIFMRQNGMHCMNSILGVVSFGALTCGTGLPSVYTRVSHFVPWIERIVWPRG